MGIWNAADVVNTVLAGVGIALTAVGLAVVFWQVRQARGAAEAAREAATEAREAMARHMTAMDLGSVQTGLRALQDVLRRGDMEYALTSCQSIREQVVALRGRSLFQERSERLAEHTHVLAILVRIEEEIERDLQTAATGDQAESKPRMDVAAANSEISDAIDLVVGWRQDAVFSATEVPSHEQHPD